MPLIIQLRMSGARPPDKIRDAIHLFLAFGGEPFKSLGVIDQTRFRLIRGEVHEFSQHGVSRRKQFGMIAGTSVVPITERFPLIAVFSWTENIAFGRENEIRTNRQRELGKSCFEQID